MTTLKIDLQRLPTLLVGFIFLALGIMLTKRSDLGMAPWGVFHQGLSIQLTLSFGVVTQLVGLFVLVISLVFLKTKIGIGTVLNVLIVGPLIDLYDTIIGFEPSTIYAQYSTLVAGIILMTFGRSLYISAQLGSGPRDGVFVGLHHLTSIDIKYIKPSIEFTVLMLGYLLGGTAGVGTVLVVISSGYFVQMFMLLLMQDALMTPKSFLPKQYSLLDYIKK